MVRTSTLRKVRHSSRLELSQSALKKNINFLRKKIGSEPRFSAVVKANAYGHGVSQMVKMLERCGVDHFSVASAFEAEEVHNACLPMSTVMIMGILYDEDLEWVIGNDIEFYVFNHHRLPTIRQVAEKLGKKAKVHIEVETGTNRTGMSEPFFPEAIDYLIEHQQFFEFVGVCTHLGGAESFSHREKIQGQIERYHRYLRILEEKNVRPRYQHIACSAAALAYPETRMDLVRIGVATYGFWPSREIYYHHLQEVNKKKDNPLHRIVSWKTDIMDIKTVPEGEYIGYGTAYQALREMRVAVLPLGYSNGYPRDLSNQGYVLIKGRKAPIVGLINMNLFMVDISHIPEAQLGDEVVLLGKQRNSTIKVRSFTEPAHLLNNEMLSRLPTAIPRVIVR